MINTVVWDRDSVGRISIENVATALKKVRSMDSAAQIALADEIFENQPNLLGSCLVQQNLGVGNNGLELLLNILLVCYQAMKESGFEWPMISEDEQERQLKRMVGAVKFSRGFSNPRMSNAASEQYLESHPERALLAFVLNECNEWLAQIASRHSEAESDKFALMASFNLVNCIAYSGATARRR
jgi:hypothetical protein